MRLQPLYKHVILFVCSFFLLLIIPGHICYAEDDEDGFYIENMDIQVIANSDRSYDITETIDVFFTEEKHGIIRTIPTSSSLEKSVKLDHVSVTGVPYTFDGFNDIKIGDPDKTVTGKQQYVIHYSLIHYADTESDADYLYLNLIGTEWNTQIKNFTASITLPEGATITKCTLTGGPYGSKENDVATYSVDTSTNQAIITVLGSRTLEANEGVTIDVQLPEGSFSLAEQWVPNLLFHTISSDISLDSYGVETVATTYDVTVNKDASFSFDQKDYMDERTDRILECQVTLPSGEIQKSDSLSSYNYIHLSNYVGQRITFSVQYKKAYKVTIGSGGHRLHLSLYDSNWANQVEHVTATYQMPFTVSKESVANSYNYLITDDLYPENDYTLTSNNMSGTFEMDTIGKGTNPIVLVLSMPETNFIRDFNMYDYLLPIFGLILTILLFLLSRRNKANFNPVPQFYPPDDMNPAEIGYLIDEHLDYKDIISLLYYWASKGLLSIHFKKNKSYTLYKKSKMGNQFQPYEHILFDAIFENGSREKVTSEVLNNSLYSKVGLTKDAILANYTNQNSLVDLKSKRLHLLLSLIIPFIMLVLVILSDSTRGFSLIGSIVTCLFLYTSCLIIIAILTKYYKKRYNHNTSKGAYVTITVAIMFISFITYMVLVYRIILSPIATILSFLFLMCMVLIIPTIRRRSPYGNELLEKVVGFQLFLQTAEKDRLLLLLEENPEYYYDILPYAQVLGVSRQWVHKFDDLAHEQPDWLDYDDTYSSDYFLYESLSRSMTDTMTSSPSSDSGDSYDSGGSSGGGSGGGGGSSW